MIELSAEEFLEFGPATLRFDDWLAGQWQVGLSLAMRVAANAVEFKVMPGASAGAGKRPRIELSLQSDIVPAASYTPAAGVLLPLIAPITDLLLPSKQAYAFRNRKRSVADFVLRNVLYGICRKEVDLKVVANVVDACMPPQQLAKRYLWILKSVFPDHALRSENVFEELILNTRIGLVEFQSAMLRNGALEMRVACAADQSRSGIDGAEFMELRRSVLELLA
jgi:hypothetical protein